MSKQTNNTHSAPSAASCLTHSATGQGPEYRTKYAFDAFGNLLASTGGTPNEYLYSGERWDPNLQFYYLRLRLFNPQTGRFWTRDTFEGVLSEPRTLHKYLYAENDPVNLIDPTGNFSFIELLSVQTIDRIVKVMQGIGANVATRQASVSLLRSQLLKRMSAQSLSRVGNALAKKITQGWFKKYVKQFSKNMTRVAVLKVGSSTPAIRNHIADNIMHKKYTVLSSYLGREGAVLRSLNRGVALSDRFRKEPDGNTLAVKNGRNNSFDEFPFASSLQGAALFPQWNSVRAVPAIENSRQGGQLSAHYRANQYRPGFTTIVIPMGYGPDSTELEKQAREMVAGMLRDLLGH